tara:strand:+ start:165 stop:596 length:432 start_codon:yes stop_codon:yes gene_type:complete
MKVFIYSIIFIFILTSKSYSENMIPLKTYLKNNKNFKDLTRTLYLLKRCTSLHYFLSNNEFSKKDNNVRIRYEKDYNFFSMKLYKILNVENSDFTKLNKKVDDQIMRFSKIYSIDGRENLSKTGSHFKKSYILDDLKICSKIQ